MNGSCATSACRTRARAARLPGRCVRSPATPSVLPRSSVPRNFFFSHLPSFIARRRPASARERQHQRAGVLGDADAVGARRVDDEDAARAGGGDVDVVDAGAGAGDDAQPRRGSMQRRGDLRRAAHEQRVGVGEIGGELGGLAARNARRRSSRLGAQQVQRGAGRSSATTIFNVSDSIIRGFWSPRLSAFARLALLWCKSLKHSKCRVTTP